MYDVIIIGAGASGAAIARELSRYQGRFCVLEKEADICCGTSKANSGIVHAGFDAKEGSLMAKLNVKGNKMMENLSKELDFSYKKNGSLVVCTNESEVEKLNELLERGKRNGVEGLQILDREELKALEPNISDEAVAALYAPTGGIVCPFGLTIAFAENAAQNGVEFPCTVGVTSTPFPSFPGKVNTVWLTCPPAVLSNRKYSPFRAVMCIFFSLTILWNTSAYTPAALTITFVSYIVSCVQIRYPPAIRPSIFFTS